MASYADNRRVHLCASGYSARSDFPFDTIQPVPAGRLKFPAVRAAKYTCNQQIAVAIFGQPEAIKQDHQRPFRQFKVGLYLRCHSLFYQPERGTVGWAGLPYFDIGCAQPQPGTGVS